MSDRQTDVAVSGAILLGLITMVCLSIGVSLVFSGGWALIVVGGVTFVYSLVVAFSRRSQTLLYADTTTNKLRN